MSLAWSCEHYQCSCLTCMHPAVSLPLPSPPPQLPPGGASNSPFRHSPHHVSPGGSTHPGGRGLASDDIGSRWLWTMLLTGDTQGDLPETGNFNLTSCAWYK